MASWLLPDYIFPTYRDVTVEFLKENGISALLIDKKLYITNTGDSRLYFGDAEGMTQITRDHSYVQTLVDMGQLTPEEAENNPHKNIIPKKALKSTVNAIRCFFCACVFLKFLRL